MTTIAIRGSGIAATGCAHILTQAGLRVAIKPASRPPASEKRASIWTRADSNWSEMAASDRPEVMGASPAIGFVMRSKGPCVQLCAAS